MAPAHNPPGPKNEDAPPCLITCPVRETALRLALQTILRQHERIAELERELKEAQKCERSKAAEC